MRKKDFLQHDVDFPTQIGESIIGSISSCWKCRKLMMLITIFFYMNSSFDHTIIILRIVKIDEYNSLMHFRIFMEHDLIDDIMK